MPAIVDIQVHDTYYQFVFYSAAGKPLLASRWYPSLPLCEQAITDLIYQVLAGYKPAHVRDRSGRFSFAIRHTQQMLIAQSVDFVSYEDSMAALELLRNQVAAASAHAIGSATPVPDGHFEESNRFLQSNSQSFAHFAATLR